jgi:hypothetical protein
MVHIAGFEPSYNTRPVFDENDQAPKIAPQKPKKEDKKDHYQITVTGQA